MINEEYMSLALHLARATLGQTSPNPAVGAVVVNNGRIVGTGAHLKAGEQHAEIIALDMAGSSAIDATLYVTLEPCCHQGKTGPCSQYIISHKIKKVIIATLDPNPKVTGKGVIELQNSGIIVEVGLLQEQAIKLNRFFFYYIQSKLPYVTIKAGMSLDGKIATTSSESKWITNSIARIDAHYYRHIHDAILIGVNSVIADNPSLTTRINNNGTHPSSSTRIILDTNLRTPPDAKIVTDRKHPTLIITGYNADVKNKIDLYDKDFVNIIKLNSPKIELLPLLQILAQRNICSILVEGGSEVISSFIEANLFNQLILYVSPILIGGKNAPSLFAATGFSQLQHATKLEFEDIQQLDSNLKIIANNVHLSLKITNRKQSSE